MQNLKAVLKNFEEALFRLEEAVYLSKQQQEKKTETIAELKGVIKNTYNRIDVLLQQGNRG